MIFIFLLAAASVLGSLPGAVLSNVPRRRMPLAVFLLALSSAALFLAVLCLPARSLNLTEVIDRFFPDRLSKLLGCGLLFGLCCLLGLLAGILRAGGLRRYFGRVSGSRPHRAAILGASGSLLLLAAACAVLSWTPTPTPIRLSEVCCANFGLKTDPDYGKYADYIELINTGNAPADIGGCFLSDKSKKRDRFRLPSLILEPGECVVLWADGTGRSGVKSGKDIHLNFYLRSGEPIRFFSPNGVLLDQVTVPEWYKNISLSKKEGAWILAQGSPGNFNDWAAPYTPPTLEAPKLSLVSGFYREPQTLTITIPEGCQVRYSLDGSVPTVNSPLYEGPLTIRDISDQPNLVVSQPNTTEDRSGAVTEPVDKGTVLRAAAFDETGARSETVTAVYFIGEAFDQYRGSAVLSITAAPIDLFGNYGICVTGLDYDRWLESDRTTVAPWPMFRRRGRSTERDAVIQLWSADGSLILDEPCGLRLQGDSSRARPLKRFRLIAREIYNGSNLFSAPIFKSSPSHSFTTRADSKDVVAHALLSERKLGGLAAVRATVFLNGEFYDHFYLRERYDPQYFRNHYGADPEDLILIEDDELVRGTDADYADYRALMDYAASNDCSDPEVYAEICRQIDPESFAAFVAANLYLNNTDWSVYKDCRLWRTRSTGGEGVLDGRWHWLVYDMDAVYWARGDFYGDAPTASYDLFRYPAPGTEGSFQEMPFFRDLLRSPAFRDLFARTWLELMNADLSAERGMALIRKGGYPSSFWSSFLRNRPKYAVDLLIEHIVPEGETCSLTLSVSDPAGGVVKLGVLPPAFQGGTWTGSWVTGVSAQLTAEPAEGWRFVRWEGAIPDTAASVTVTPEGNTNVVAVFERIP